MLELSTVHYIKLTKDYFFLKQLGPTHYAYGSAPNSAKYE